MGKKDRSKNSMKGSEKSKRLKKELLLMSNNLIQMCIQNHNVSDDWECFVDIYKAVELFKRKQNKGIKTIKPVSRVDTIPNFEKWLNENGVISSNIKLDEVKSGGLGFLATNDIKEGQLLTTISERVMIKVSDARKSYLGRSIEQSEMLLRMPNVLLALFLHCEKYKPDSFYKPYLDILPSKFNTTLYFSPDELKYLKDTKVLGTAVNHYKSIVRQFAVLYQMLNLKTTNSEIPDAAIEMFDFDAYKWAVSAVTTRQNKIPKGCCESSGCGQDPFDLALIPFWDMFNHSSGQMSTVYNNELKSIVCVAMKDFHPSDEVTICYGSRPNSELLVHNGFVLTDNPYDEVYIAFGVSSKDPLYVKRVSLLARFSIEASSYFTLKKMQSVSLPRELLIFLRVFHMSSDELDKWFASDVKDLIALQDVSKMSKSEEVMWKFLKNRLQLLLMRIDKTMNLILLDKFPSNNSKLAVALRAEEKKIIESYLEFCDQMETRQQAVSDEVQQNETTEGEEKKVSDDLKDTEKE